MAGRYQAYPEYKDSGVEWLGKVPAHWRVAALRRSLLEHKQGYYTTDDYVDDGVKLLRITDLRDFGDIDISNCPKVPTNDTSLLNYELINGDVVFARTGGAGSFGVVKGLEERVVFASYLIRFRFCNSFVENNYLRYMLLADSFQMAIKQNIHGGVNQNIHAEDIKNAYLARPPLDEQQQIANFLDNETAKIDTLIEKQQQLIKLLREKRQAVISHAVTKGLNPDAPMRDSGVKWLGEVPAHWGVKRLKYLCDVQTGARDTVNAIDEGKYPFFVRSQTVERINSMAFDCEAVLTAGDGVGVGKVYHYIKGPFDFHQRVYMLNNFYHVTGKFIFNYLERNFYKVAMAGQAKSTVDSLRLPLFLNFEVTVPPLNEQKEIMIKVENLKSRYEKLILSAEAAIGLLLERRTALISAAVIGKIDVRKWQAPEENLTSEENAA